MSVWPSGQSAAMPRNFLKALPKWTAEQYVADDGADTVVQRGHVLKYWSPTALGIAGTAPGLSGIKYQITTPWLNVTPCQFFAATIRRGIPAGDNIAAPPFNLAVQYKQTPADAPALSLTVGGGLDEIHNAWNIVDTVGCVFPALAGAATERWTCLWGINQYLGHSSIIAPVVIGPWIRVQMDYSTNPPNPLDHSTYSMSLLGSS